MYKPTIIQKYVCRHVDEEAQQLLTDYRDRRARKKMLDNRAIYKRYEIEWIGREGLAPETHEEYPGMISRDLTTYHSN